MSVFSKANYLNKEISSLRNVTIREYDMQDAGMTFIREHKLLSPEEIAELEAMPKHARNIAVGMKRKTEKEFSKQLTALFRETVRDFLVLNEINPVDLLSIKNDAVFLIGNRAPKITVVNGAKFINKETYSSYFALSDCEFYYNGMTRKMDVKGLGKGVVMRHRPFMLAEIAKIIRANESNERSGMIRILRDFRERYLTYRLDLECYREMNNDSMFAIKDGDRTFYVDSLSNQEEYFHENLDISFNYMKFIIPLISGIV